MVSGKCGAAWLSLELVPNTRQSRRSQASARQNGRLYFDAPMTHCSSHHRLLQQNRHYSGKTTNLNLGLLIGVKRPAMLRRGNAC